MADCNGTKIAEFRYIRRIVQNEMEESVLKDFWVFIKKISAEGKPDGDGDGDDIGIHIKPGENGGAEVEISVELQEFFTELQTKITIERSEDEKKIIDAGFCVGAQVFTDKIYTDIRKEETKRIKERMLIDLHFTRDWYERMQKVLRREMRDNGGNESMRDE